MRNEYAVTEEVSRPLNARQVPVMTGHYVDIRDQDRGLGGRNVEEW